MTACSYIQVVTTLLKYLMQQGVGQKVCMCVEGVLLQQGELYGQCSYHLLTCARTHTHYTHRKWLASLLIAT